MRLDILEIKGKVRYKITLDPGAWLFDERKIDLEEFFSGQDRESAGEGTDKGGSSSRNPSERVTGMRKKAGMLFEKEQLLTRSFGIRLGPFIENAEPEEGATTLTILTEGEKVSFPLQEGKQLIAAFSRKGKPIRDGGPVHILYPDGSNLQNPITHVKGFFIE
jgi:hypothetical protein